MKKRILSLALLLSLAVSLFVVLPAAAAEESPIQVLEGAAIRLGDDAETSGLRFAFTVDAAWYKEQTDADKTVAVGALIVPTDKLGEATFTKEALTAAGIQYLDIVADGTWNSESTETELCFYASIVKLNVTNYAREFSAVGYVTVDGVTQYSAVSDSRSVYSVAKEYLAGSEYAAADDATKAKAHAYLDTIVELDAKTLKPVTYAGGYASPYTAKVENQTLTVSGTAVDTVKSVVIGSNVYTGGWTANSENTAFTAPYTKHAHVYDRAGTLTDWLICSACGATAMEGTNLYTQNFGTAANSTPNSSGVCSMYWANTGSIEARPGTPNKASYTVVDGKLQCVWGNDNAAGKYQALRTYSSVSTAPAVSDMDIFSYGFKVKVDDVGAGDKNFIKIQLSAFGDKTFYTFRFRSNKDNTGFAIENDVTWKKYDCVFNYDEEYDFRFDAKFAVNGSTITLDSVNIFVNGELKITVPAADFTYTTAPDFNASATGASFRMVFTPETMSGAPNTSFTAYFDDITYVHAHAKTEAN